MTQYVLTNKQKTSSQNLEWSELFGPPEEKCYKSLDFNKNFIISHEIKMMTSALFLMMLSFNNNFFVSLSNVSFV